MLVRVAFFIYFRIWVERFSYFRVYSKVGCLLIGCRNRVGAGARICFGLFSILVVGRVFCLLWNFRYWGSVWYIVGV